MQQDMAVTSNIGSISMAVPQPPAPLSIDLSGLPARFAAVVARMDVVCHGHCGGPVSRGVRGDRAACGAPGDGVPLDRGWRRAWPTTGDRPGRIGLWSLCEPAPVRRCQDFHGRAFTAGHRQPDISPAREVFENSLQVHGAISTVDDSVGARLSRGRRDFEPRLDTPRRRGHGRDAPGRVPKDRLAPCPSIAPHDDAPLAAPSGAGARETRSRQFLGPAVWQSSRACRRHPDRPWPVLLLRVHMNCTVP